MMARGGPRKPAKPASVSGPGSLSKRTDGRQPIRTPGLSDPGMQYGDVGKLQAAQHVAPLPQASSGTSAPVNRAPGQGKALPDFLFQQPTARPGEPGTTGLSTGPGGGPEVLPPTSPSPEENLLQFMWQRTGNEQFLQKLDQIRAERQQTPAPGAPAPGGPPIAPMLSAPAGPPAQGAPVG